MNRRQFLRAGAGGLGAAALGLAGQAGGSKPLRVGMIGCGWYGKSDLLRLIQVSPVEVVSLCDVDRRMLAEAAEVVSVRQASHKKPRTFSDYRTMLAEKPKSKSAGAANVPSPWPRKSAPCVVTISMLPSTFTSASATPPKPPDEGRLSSR